MTSAKSTTPARYRVYQFFVALKAGLPSWGGGVKGGLSLADAALVTSILPTTAQQQLFGRMAANDQRHAIAVARTLQQAGHDNLALLQAALLHDAAKSLGQPLIHRVLIVLLEAFWPGALARLSTPPFPLELRGDLGPGWRRPFVIHAQHPALGAAWAQAAACEPAAVDLIARHQDKLQPDSADPQERLLAALQWADNLN